MGIIKKTCKTESLLSAERKVCKRLPKAAPELPEEIPASALRYKGSKRPQCGNLGGTTEMSSSQRHFNDRDGGFFYFPRLFPIKNVI